MRDDDDPVVLSGLMKRSQRGDGLFPNFAAHRDIARRVSEITRRIAKIGLQKHGIETDIEHNGPAGDRRAPMLRHAPRYPTVAPDDLKGLPGRREEGNPVVLYDIRDDVGSIPINL